MKDKIFDKRWHVGVIVLLTIILYANTFTHDFAQDDAIVITENVLVKEGFSGIIDIFTHDSFYGFFQDEGKANLVAGGRYRPLSLALFAVEYAIFGPDPWHGHFFNILWYTLVGLVVYALLNKLLKPVSTQNFALLLAFTTTILFIAHPIHTEAVANIKGRDEILAMFFSCLSLYLLIDNSTKWINRLASAGLFVLAILSKENSISFIGIGFIAFYFFRNKNIVNSLFCVLPLIAGGIIYLVMRSIVIDTGLGDPPMEMMNNPFIKYEDGNYQLMDSSEKWGSIIYALGKYIQLLVFPHPLTNDYYPRQIGIPIISNPYAIISLIIHIAMIALALLWRKKQPIISFAIGFYFISLIIYTNILFPVGTHLSERFLFMPSLGFCLGMGYILSKSYYKKNLYVYGSIFFIFVFLYGLKTVTRNQVWKDDFTLFTTDVQVSSNSAKALNAAGGALSTKSTTIENTATKIRMLDDAIAYLKKAVVIHPNYKNAWLLMGNAYIYKDEIFKAIEAYESALNIDPNYPDARSNMAIALRQAGHISGEKNNDLIAARKYLLRSLSFNNNDAETYRLLGITEGQSGNTSKAIEYFQKLVQLKPNLAAAYVLLAQAYRHAGDEDKARAAQIKAVQLDPEALK